MVWFLVSAALLAALFWWVGRPSKLLKREIITLTGPELEMLAPLLSKAEFHFLLNCVGEALRGGLPRATTLADVMTAARNLHVN